MLDHLSSKSKMPSAATTNLYTWHGIPMSPQVAKPNGVPSTMPVRSPTAGVTIVGAVARLPVPAVAPTAAFAAVTVPAFVGRSSLKPATMPPVTLTAPVLPGIGTNVSDPPDAAVVTAVSAPTMTCVPRSNVRLGSVEVSVTGAPAAGAALETVVLAVSKIGVVTLSVVSRTCGNCGNTDGTTPWICTVESEFGAGMNVITLLSADTVVPIGFTAPGIATPPSTVTLSGTTLIPAGSVSVTVSPMIGV